MGRWNRIASVAVIGFVLLVGTVSYVVADCSGTCNNFVEDCTEEGCQQMGETKTGYMVIGWYYWGCVSGGDPSWSCSNTGPEINCANYYFFDDWPDCRHRTDGYGYKKTGLGEGPDCD